MNKTRILQQIHRDDGGDFVLYITHHNSGEGDVYRSEDKYEEQISWGTLIHVLSVTADWLKNARKHECKDCSDWRPLSN